MFPVYTLNNGVQIPAIGLGTFQMRSVAGDDVIYRAIDSALRFGYRLIGLVRSIGVSNYTVDHLEELLQFASVVPAVLQVEFHPRLYQKNLHEYCQSKRIWLQAYTSLGQGKLLDEEVVRSIATQHNKSTAQVLLRWALQHGVGIIPKSVRSQHIQDNISITEFELSAYNMESLNLINNDTHFCWDPTEVK
ncbi:PREDICTED: glyoxal reductase-like [Acropora digitifera]|uniref:glyoxal reductase-like n=1 Tax=Acropora digitifera TaxID=70779 RepID=UPI00077AA8FF|nr:PREDICTED: glyoxal reductase-like [Acropora digitifera]